MTARAGSRRILYIGYPLLPVSDESCGGAEQMLATLEAEMSRRGYATTLAACEGSRPAGELAATGPATEVPDHFEIRDEEQNACIIELLRARRIMGRPFDLIHDKSGSFWKHAATMETPVLATLHLPRANYPDDLLRRAAPNVYWNCVSETQLRSFRDLPRMLGVVRNGIALERFPFTTEKDRYLLWLGRLCVEKGAHIAIHVARECGLPLIVAGQVYPFSYHEAYFRREVRPHLDGKGVRMIDSPTVEQKVELLRHAHAVLVPSLVEETSSLVSIEAMACGTPVVAFRRGAIPEVVEHERTGFVIERIEEMVEAVRRVGEIDKRACRNHVERNYSASAMADRYEELYQRVLRRAEVRVAAD